jgi:glyoxylase-like metal-dependent hydrolase (beta-lactamase superfamily II)
MLRVHHFNCGTLCPLAGLTPNLVCHCLVIETQNGLVLVDTGLGTQDVVRPNSRLTGFSCRLFNPQLKLEDTALKQIERLGFQHRDVRHIVLTHMDFDHAGGLSDFPDAKIHLLNAELIAARGASTWTETHRYRRAQWENVQNWVTYRESGERWFGFDCVQDLEGLPPEILLVPLIGHTWGHTGVAIQTSSGWLLHAGDAYFYRGELDLSEYHCPPGLRLLQMMMEVDREARIHNQKRLRRLVLNHGDEVKVFSGHDALELSQFQPREVSEPRGVRTHTVRAATNVQTSL